MTRAKKRAIITISCCVVAIAGGLLFGELASHHEPLLAAIAVIVAFGVGICLIFIMEDGDAY